MTHAYGGIFSPDRISIVAYARCGFEDRRNEKPWSEPGKPPTCPECAHLVALEVKP